MQQHIPKLGDIDAIILDLGGVLFDIDYHLTAQAFKDLGVHNFDDLYSQAKQTDVFDQLEVGSMSPGEFRHAVRDLSGLQLSDDRIDGAWNAMLLGMPEHRISWLEELGNHKPLYLLSNTNAIHIPAFKEIMKGEGLLDRFEDVFEAYYYSSIIGKRKPDVDTFLFVCDSHGVDPSRAFFVDDSVQHVMGAQEAGLNAYHLNTQAEDVVNLIRV